MQEEPTQGGLFDLAWLAGWLEGEGSFYAYDTPSGLKIGVKSGCIDRDVVERAHRIGGGIMRGPVSFDEPNRRDMWFWHLGGRKECVILMRLLRPHMGARRQAQIDAALEVEERVPRRIPAKHGTISKYNRGCKCEPCRLAQNEYQRDRRRRLREEARNAG